MAEKNENTERNEKEEKFQAKLKELLALAKKKKNVWNIRRSVISFRTWS